MAPSRVDANEPKSWGEALRRRELERRQGTPLVSNGTAPPAPSPIASRAQLNIITGEYKDGKYETETRQKESQASLVLAEKAKRRLRYNFISHDPSLGYLLQEKGTRHSEKVRRQPDSRVSYNILTPHADLLTETPGGNPAPPVTQVKGFRRAYHVITNERIDFGLPGDPERPPVEHRIKQAFNPLTCKFRDRQRDKAYRAQYAISKDHASKWESRLQPTILSSEDHAYDLISKQLRYPKIAENAKHTDNLAQRRLARERILQYQEKMQAAAACADERSVRRANWQRYASRGYNVITNEKIGGRCGGPVRNSPFASVPSSPWDRLSMRPATSLGLCGDNIEAYRGSNSPKPSATTCLGSARENKQSSIFAAPVVPQLHLHRLS